MHHQIQQLAARQLQMANLAQQRAILVTHPLQMGQLGVGVSIPSQVSMANSTSAATITVCIRVSLLAHRTNVFYFNVHFSC